MATAVLIIVLLTVAASLASWLFSQWVAQRAGLTGAALALGGSGALVMIGTAAFVIVTATTWWQKVMPVFDSSTLIAPAATPAGGAAATAAREPDSTTRADRYADFGIARSYLAANPSDADMLSMLARSTFAAEHPAKHGAVSRSDVAQTWLATACVQALRSEQSSRWMLDNRCDGALVVLFASCQLSESACFSSVGISAAWSYEPAGILMTGANDRPVPLRVAEGGPLVAPIFTIRDSAGARRQIRYLACHVTAPGLLRALHEVAMGELTQQRLTAELRADACYSQVLDWTRRGQQLGKSPEALLRDTFDEAVLATRSTTGQQQ